MQQRGRLALMLLLAGVLAGCSVQPSEYRSDKEIPEGPGMISGQDGRLLLFSNTVQADDRPLLGRGRSGDGDAAPSEVGADEQAFREFQRFQEYQAWKEQARETGEYQEFREWLRWREYQRWEEEGAER